MLRIKKIFEIFMIMTVMVLNSACQSAFSEPVKEGVMSIKISSPAFIEGGTIPENYTCDGENISPSLNWSGIPKGTQSLALIMDDPDAPIGIFVHWVIYGMDGKLSGLPEGVTKSATVEGIGLQGINSFRKTGYDGPCPPKGTPHRYYFKLYALDSVIALKPGASKSDVEKAIESHVLGQGQFMGKYGR
jgi:Raf kinase inhibitor-like YbhB/YbcL family protein